MQNKGLSNERNLINSINNKLYKQLNDNLKSFIKFMYKDIDYNDIIYAKKINNIYKSDICIKVGKLERNVSVKSGSENSIHLEKLDSFIVFLKSIKVNENIINYLRLYHYGDDTYNGRGTKRYSAEQSKNKYYKEIMIFNKYVSYDNLLEKILNRFLFYGLREKNKVDYIYYGNENYGIWASREEIVKYLINNKCYHIRTIHFSSLTLQNWCRNINMNKKSENHREYIQIKWFSLVSDLQKIRER